MLDSALKAVVTLTIIVAVLGTIAQLQFARYDNMLHRSQYDRVINGFNHLFSLKGEGNVTSWFSSTIWFVTGMLLYITANLNLKLSKKYHRQYLVASIICVYLSLDESAQLHENIPKVMIPGTRGHTTIWVYPMCGLALFTAIYCWRLFYHFPYKVKLYSLGGGVIFIAGAAGFEYIRGTGVELGIENRILFLPIIVVEELCEMVGVLLFLCGQLLYLRDAMEETAPP